MPEMPYWMPSSPVRARCQASPPTISAMLLSLKVVARNPMAMLIWGALLVILVSVGFATGFLALIYTAPIAGHATWHAYRDLIATEG